MRRLLPILLLTLPAAADITLGTVRSITGSLPPGITGTTIPGDTIAPGETETVLLNLPQDSYVWATEPGGGWWPQFEVDGVPAWYGGGWRAWNPAVWHPYAAGQHVLTIGSDYEAGAFGVAISAATPVPEPPVALLAGLVAAWGLVRRKR
jgi:hypothetical protein